MKIVLISTYELGRQPFGLVSPAAWLRKRGHAVACLDLTRQALDACAVREAELLALYLPMHTGYLRSLGVGTILGGEFEGGLARLAERLGSTQRSDKNFPQRLKPSASRGFMSELKQQ